MTHRLSQYERMLKMSQVTSLDFDVVGISAQLGPLYGQIGKLQKYHLSLGLKIIHWFVERSTITL